MEISSSIFRNENDLVPNGYVARFMTWIGWLMVPVEILNETGIFKVNVQCMRIAAVIVLASMFSIRRLGLNYQSASKPSTKYVITVIALFMVFAALTMLEQWASVALFLPLFIAAQYHNRRVSMLAVVGTCLTGLLSAPLGCVSGLWDPAFLSYQLQALGYSVELTALEGSNLTGSFIRMLLYIGLPRLMLALIFGTITFSIARTSGDTISERVKETGLSRIDALTNVFSRVSWEVQLDACNNGKAEASTCVYADVNGLHELNNAEGHDAGDRLLVTCANALVEVFGPCVYRTGGDEFVVLTNQSFNINMRIQQTAEILKRQGFSMSMGGARLEEGETVCEMVRRAEKIMYAEKRAYYQRQGYDRRGRL